MKTKNNTAVPVTIKVNTTAAKNAIKNIEEEKKKPVLKKITIPVVKDIDESNPERK
ncbi:MAG: hypothetical protein ABI581_16770 [Sediminibacterium sp.]